MTATAGSDNPTTASVAATGGNVGASAVVGSLDNLLSAVEAAPPRRRAEEGASFHQHLSSKLDRYKLANLAGWNKIFCDVHTSFGEFSAHDTEQALVIGVEYT